MVDLTVVADTEEDMDEAPATPPPNVSDSEGDMETDDEDELLAYAGQADSSDDDGSAP